MTQIVPPKWIQEPRDVQAIVGQDVTLPCTVQGFPEPSTVWTRTNGKYMKDSSTALCLVSITYMDKTVWQLGNDKIFEMLYTLKMGIHSDITVQYILLL